MVIGHFLTKWCCWPIDSADGWSFVSINCFCSYSFFIVGMYYYSYYYCHIISFIIKASYLLLCWSTNSMHMLRQSIAACIYPNYRLWFTVNVVKKGSLWWLHERRFPWKVMYAMFTEWRRDIRNKMALSCLDCKAVVCMQRVSFNPSETFTS